MVDDTQQASGSKKKSPLDVLEDILEDSKKAAKAPVAMPGQAKTADNTNTAQQEAEQLAQMQQQQAQQAQADQAQIQAKLQEIAGLENSPQVQAAAQQKQAQEAAEQKHEDFMEGNEIIQLGHKKVEINE